MVVARLLSVLTQRSATCMCLVRLEPWHALMQGFAGQAEPIRALAGSTARALARTLIVAASGLDNVREGQIYIENLLGPMIGGAFPAFVLLSPQQMPLHVRVTVSRLPTAMLHKAQRDAGRHKTT